MPTDTIFWFQVVTETLTLFVLLVGLVGLLIPVFPGLTVMWLATLLYALLQNSVHLMTGWGWFLFAIITILMLAGNVVDNVIIARKMRDKFIPWSSIILSFIAGIVASLFLTPIMGLVASPVALYGSEYLRLKNGKQAWESTKSYMIGWGWSFAARFMIGVVMTGLWMVWAWL